MDSGLALASSVGLLMLFIYAGIDHSNKISNSYEEDRLPVNATIDDAIHPFDASVSGFAAVGVLVACAVLALVQLWEYERARRAALARRLRLKGSRDEVALAPLAPGHFHLFLSHQWGDGQDQMRVVKQRLIEMIPDVRCFLDVDDLKKVRRRLPACLPA